GLPSGKFHSNKITGAQERIQLLHTYLVGLEAKTREEFVREPGANAIAKILALPALEQAAAGRGFSSRARSEVALRCQRRYDVLPCLPGEGKINVLTRAFQEAHAHVVVPTFYGQFIFFILQKRFGKNALNSLQSKRATIGPTAQPEQNSTHAIDDRFSE